MSHFGSETPQLSENYCCKGIPGNVLKKCFFDSQPLYSSLLINMLINLGKEFSIGLNEREEIRKDTRRENAWILTRRGECKRHWWEQNLLSNKKYKSSTQVAAHHVVTRFCSGQLGFIDQIARAAKHRGLDPNSSDDAAICFSSACEMQRDWWKSDGGFGWSPTLS